MAPAKALSKITTNITTRSKTQCENTNPNKVVDKHVRGKRKADCSPSKDKAVKRSALINLTNNYKKIIETRVTKPSKPITVQAKILPTVKTVQKPKQNENLAPPPAPVVNKIVTRATVKNIVHCATHTAVKPKEANKENTALVAVTTKKRLSNEFEKSDGSLYSTALEESNNDSTYFSAKRPTTRALKLRASSSSAIDDGAKSISNLSFVALQLQTKLNLGNHEVPEGVIDYDKENWDDIYQVSHYAMDIFNYYKEKEKEFPVGDYIDKQICLSKWMRSLLVDWMVEIQESFELNHETLYLGVKLVDMYLDRVTVSKETLQLVGAAAMFVASKFDERIPPMIDDFLYICDGAYTSREMIKMEANLLKVVGFNLGIPISYRFLRRYARCSKITMNVLTLARYILEFSLMEYETVTIRDSLLASASLYLSLRMKEISGWTPTLQFYTGYELNDLRNTVLLLNRAISKPPKSQLMTVRNKYSHKIFFEVAKTPLLSDANLF
ncbi:G2/mitotic-specific cyclin-B3 isoform X2 [Euwallacea similis]|uniref:G2/mitotic-specific cyclin-B3 isoform X2 n=1 Tax=Euwallacea similis TaxID=1736056 RepID=UPI00344C5780